MSILFQCEVQVIIVVVLCSLEEALMRERSFDCVVARLDIINSFLLFSFIGGDDL